MSLHGKLLSLAILLSAIPLGCQAQTAAMYRLPKLGSLLSNTSWAIADFDGDGKPDVVSSSTEFRNPGFVGKRLDLNFGQAVHQEPPIDVTSLHSNIDLSVWDVDGDRDIDIVVTSARSHELLGVWINDGQGRFTAGDISSVTSDNDAEAAPSLDLPEHRSERLTLPAQQQRVSEALRTSLRSVSLPDDPSIQPTRGFRSLQSRDGGVIGWRGPPLAS